MVIPSILAILKVVELTKGQTLKKKRSRPNIQNRGWKENNANVARENHSLSPPNVYMLHSYEDAFLSLDSSTSSSSSFFIIDSGALAHMCHDQSFYSSYHKIDPPRSIYMANNGVLEAVGVSDINICTTHNRQTKSSLIKGALHLPWLHTSLLSVAQLADAGVRTISDPQHIDLVDIHTSK